MAAAIVGIINGVFTVMFRIPSFITTLGTLFFDQWLHADHLWRFSRAAESGASASGNLRWKSRSRRSCGRSAVTLILQFVLVKTRWGLHTIATGGNPIGAAEVGIKIGRIKIGNFVICSVLGGLAGTLDTFRIGSIDPLAGGTEIMFMAIASAVIGGTLLTEAQARSLAHSSAPQCLAS